MKSRFVRLLAKANLPDSMFLSYFRCRPNNPGQSSDESSNESHSKTCRNIQSLGWKPIILRRPLLLIIVALTLSFVTILEYLSQKSHNDGGIAFAKVQFSATTTFGYAYLPTILAVLYSTIWSYVDIDAKRLEPWF